MFSHQVSDFIVFEYKHVVAGLGSFEVADVERASCISDRTIARGQGRMGCQSSRGAECPSGSRSLRPAPRNIVSPRGDP